MEDEEHISGEEVDPQTEDDEELAEKVDELDIGDYEEGWSTEGEGEEEGRGGLSGEVGKELDQGETVPLRDVAREVAKDAEEQEDERTRVLSVTELEDLFIGSAPPLSGKSTPQMTNETSAHQQNSQHSEIPILPSSLSVLSDTQMSVNHPLSTPSSAPRRSPFLLHRAKRNISRPSSYRTRSPCVIVPVWFSRNSRILRQIWLWTVFYRLIR